MRAILLTLSGELFLIKRLAAELEEALNNGSKSMTYQEYYRANFFFVSLSTSNSITMEMTIEWLSILPVH